MLRKSFCFSVKLLNPEGKKMQRTVTQYAILTSKRSDVGPRSPFATGNILVMCFVAEIGRRIDSRSRAFIHVALPRHSAEETRHRVDQSLPLGGRQDAAQPAVAEHGQT